MVQKVEVETVSDLSDAPDAHGVDFSWLGNGYEIDLTELEHKEMEGFLQRYIEKGRKTSSKRGRPKGSAKASAPVTSTTAGGSGLTKEQRQEVRELAAQHGHVLKERGRLPQIAITAWQLSKSTDPTEVAKVPEILKHLAA